MRIEDFEDSLQRDLAWRKMEISQLFMILNKAESKEIVGKSIILLLYAHWEGYIKKSSKYYLKYVSEKNIALEKLTRNFEAIMLKKYAHECIEADSLNLAKEFAFMDAQKKLLKRTFHVRIDADNEFDEDLINTQHNLSSKVLKNIIQIVGIEYNDAIKARNQYLDSNLVKHRNAIGHGAILDEGSGSEASPVEFSRIVRLRDFVLSMLDYYSEVLIRYTEDELYLEENMQSRNTFENEQSTKLSRKLKDIEDRTN